MPINYFETSFEARERRSQIENLYHGETVDLVAVVTTDGVPKSLDGYTATGVYQPTSMHGSEDFYELSADIVDNRIIVHWAQGSDFGEDSYMVWVLVSKEGDAAYPITWRLDMAYSPNFPLSDVVPIPKTIDFSKYELLNAPWLELSAVGDLPYLPLSGGTVDGKVSVNGTISANGLFYQYATTQFGQNAEGNGGTAVGFNAKSDSFGTAIGLGADAKSADESLPLGGTAIGFGAKAKYGYSTAIGQQASVNTTNAHAIGYGASSTGQNSIAIGPYATANADNAIQLGSHCDPATSAFSDYTNSVPNSFRVMDKMVLSGDNLTLDPERVPYLSNYAKIEDIPEVPTDLSAFTNSPGYLTAHQSLSDYYTKQEADGKFLTAHQDLTDYAKKEEVQAVDDKLSNYLPLSGGTLTGPVTVSHILTTANLEAPGIEALEDIVNIQADHLSAKNDLIVKKSIVFGDDSTISSANDLATKEELTAYATKNDLSSAIGDINTILDSINGEVI